MNASHLRLFVLQCAVIRHDLNRILGQLQVSNTRSALERETDSLISDYLGQIDFSILSSAERMAEFYQVFYALENDIRDLIEQTLETTIGESWWTTSVSSAVRDSAKRNMDNEAREGLPPRSSRMIEYITFGELSQIVSENWDSFSGIFSSVSKNRVLRVMSRLNQARGPIAHCNYLPPEEAVRLKLAIQDWYKLME